MVNLRTVRLVEQPFIGKGHLNGSVEGEGEWVRVSAHVVNGKADAIRISLPVSEGELLGWFEGVRLGYLASADDEKCFGLREVTKAGSKLWKRSNRFVVTFNYAADERVFKRAKKGALITHRFGRRGNTFVVDLDV